MNNIGEIRKGDIILVKMGNLYGTKTEELRPVLIVQNDIGNKYSPSVIACPVTSKLKSLHLPTHVTIAKGSGNLIMDSMILAEVLITFSKSELLRYIGTISDSDKSRVDTAIKVSLGIDS